MSSGYIHTRNPEKSARPRFLMWLSKPGPSFLQRLAIAVRQLLHSSHQNLSDVCTYRTNAVVKDSC